MSDESDPQPSTEKDDEPTPPPSEVEDSAYTEVFEGTRSSDDDVLTKEETPNLDSATGD